MTTKPSDTEFAVHISGLTYQDAVTLCGKRFAKAISDWHSDDDPENPDVGRILIPVANIHDAMTLFREIGEAVDWAEYHQEWCIQLRATRITPTYALGASLTDTGCDLQLKPYKPAKPAVEEALARLERTIADVRAAACLLEGQS
jgi:hypothetical protein